jgi:hypothetical protein
VIVVKIIEIVNPIPLMEKTVSWFKKKNLFAKPLDPRFKKKLATGLEEAEAFSFGLGRKTSPDEGSNDDPDPDDDCEEADS